MKKVLLLLLSTLFINLYANTKEIIVWNYYNSMPFVINKTEGLAKDFVDLLNKYSKDKYIFRLHNIPRARLNVLLENKKQGIVLFVNPSWMGKNAKNKYLWSKAILTDKNVIVSAANKKIYYETPNDLIDKSFIAIRGRKYKYIDELIEKKLIEKQIVNRETQALLLLSLNRADFTTQPKTIISSQVKYLNIENKIYISPKPLFSYTRHIMVTKPNYELYNFISEYTKKLSKKDEWKEILNKYHLSN